MASTKKNGYGNIILSEVVPKLNRLQLSNGYYYKLSHELESEGDAFGSNFIS